MADVAVIGAGVGGMAVAIRLAQAGRQVRVYEKNAVAGGKLASTVIDGFTFDTGPSLLTMPQYVNDLGVDVAAVRLQQPFRYQFSDNRSLLIDDNPEITQQAFDDFAPSGGAQWSNAIDRGHRIWEIAERTFFAGPMTGLGDMMRRMQSPRDLAGIDSMRTLHSRSTRTFKDSNLQQWLDRYATYSGSSPFKAPATLGCIPYLEQHFGSWHIPGGLAGLGAAMQQRAEQLGVEFEFDAEVTGLTSSMTLTVDDYRAESAKTVVANIDAERLYGAVMPDPRALYRVKRASRSTAAFAMLLAIDGTTPGIRHHNVLFSHDYRAEFDDIERYGAAVDPTIYVCCPTASDPSMAPAGAEAWFVLVNVAAGHSQDWQQYGDRIIRRLGIGERVLMRRDLTPSYYDEAYGAPGGAIYGTSSNGRRSAFLRAANRGIVPNLYLVGGSSHPGGGLPLVLSSARIVSEMVLDS